MEIGAPYYQSTLLPIPRQITTTTTTKVHPIPNSAIPMSQGFHHGFFGFADGFDRATQQDQSVHNQDPSSTSIYDQTAAAAASGNMLSEMFNFSSNISATDLLANQISAGYGRFQRDPPVATPLTASDWYGATANRENTLSGTGGLGLGSLRDMAVAVKHNNTQALPPGLNADSATAMQLYLMNPPPSSVSQPAVRSPSPSSTTHQALPLNHDFIAAAAAAASSFGGGVGEGQGLSLSLSSSMQQFEIAKAEELRARDGLFYYNNNPSLQHQLQGQQSQQHHGQQQLHPGFSGQIGTTNILRHSKYAKAAQELLEEFCSVGRGHLMKGKKGKRQSSSSQIGGGGASSSSSKDPPVPTLSPSDRFEHQRRKAKLLLMLDEVDRRYNHYCEQMQMVVNSFDTIMGFGAATPYTGLAQKAMSRHFRCLKDAIAAQLKNTCELLGEKDTGIGSGITKGETPRLKLLDQSLRHQRSFHHMGMMEQEAWRPQRGLPERSVNILRAWLFEHFLHPYPSDADKHLLARQTGLTRNQVSNWFINARVRLWKPMVEDMYLQESKEEENKQGEDETSQSPNKQKHQHEFQRPPAESSGTTSTGAAENKNVHSHHLLAPLSIPKQHLHQPFSSPSSSENPLSVSSSTNVGALPGMELPPPARVSNISGMNPETMIDYGPAGTQVRFGAHGDVSLTLGLRQTGNMPDQNNRFSLRDFNGR